MIKVPILSHTSVHLIGDVLIAWWLTPPLSVICMTAIVAVPAVLAGDGGLGANIISMALVPAAVVAVVSRNGMRTKLGLSLAGLAASCYLRFGRSTNRFLWRWYVSQRYFGKRCQFLLPNLTPANLLPFRPASRRNSYSLPGTLQASARFMRSSKVFRTGLCTYSSQIFSNNHAVPLLSLITGALLAGSMILIVHKPQVRQSTVAIRQKFPLFAENH